MDPAHSSSKRVADSRAETRKGSAGASLVVVVDGNAAAQRSLRVLLESGGFTVQTASTGEEALQLLRDLVPAVLILETEIPGMSGYDLCHIVKRSPRLERVPVVFLTSNSSPQSYKTGHDAGASAYMTKPCKPELLLSMVSALARMPLPAVD